jgi:prephenate dehydratase
MAERKNLTQEEEAKLLSAYKVLEEFSEHEFPVVSFNCRKAKNELWQALFELDLLPEKKL